MILGFFHSLKEKETKVDREPGEELYLQLPKGLARCQAYNRARVGKPWEE